MSDPSPEGPPALTAIGPEDVQRWVDAGATLVDVRERWEFAQGGVPGSINVPLSEFVGRLSEVPDNVVMICRAGARSERAAAYMLANGYRVVANLAGGTEAWSASGRDLESGSG